MSHPEYTCPLSKFSAKLLASALHAALQPIAGTASSTVKSYADRSGKLSSDCGETAASCCGSPCEPWHTAAASDMREKISVEVEEATMREWGFFVYGVRCAVQSVVTVCCERGLYSKNYLFHLSAG